MSTTDQRNTDSSNIPTERPQTLEEAGITRTENGNYVLPPILVEYRGGITRHLTIEVGDTMASSDGGPPSAAMAFSHLYQNNGVADVRSRSGTPVPNTETRSQSVPPSADAETGTNSSNPTQQSSSNDNDNRNNSNTAENPPNRGIRGLDYPAFDVSTNGIYNDSSQPAQRLAANTDNSQNSSGLLGPLQMALERVYGGLRNRYTSNNNAQSDSNNASNAAITPNTNGNTTVTDPIPNGTNNTSVRTATPSSLSESRNIILTVNYVFDGTPDNVGGNSGSLLLYVPRIYENNNDNVNVLVGLATKIALRTIGVTIRKSGGVSKETLEKIEVVKVKDLKANETECPICYDKYVDKDVNETRNKKRNIDTDDNKITKKIKTNDSDAVPVAADTQNVDKDNENTESKDKIVQYTHYPIKLKCGHIFGISCIYEWFKNHNSCPLCREKLPNILETSNENSRYITITLPNLARVISNSRPLIDNFNNRQMTFTMSDEDETDINNPVNITTTPAAANNVGALNNDNTDPATNANETDSNDQLLDRLLNMRAVRAANGATNDSTRSRQTIVNFIRDILSEFTRNETELGNTLGNNNNNGNTPSLVNDSNRPHIAHILERRVSRANTSFPGLFPPLGVESRRTANGVETREIGMFQSNATTSAPAIDTTESSSTVDAEPAVIPNARTENHDVPAEADNSEQNTGPANETNNE